MTTAQTQRRAMSATYVEAANESDSHAGSRNDSGPDPPRLHKIILVVGHKHIAHQRLNHHKLSSVSGVPGKQTMPLTLLF